MRAALIVLAFLAGWGPVNAHAGDILRARAGEYSAAFVAQTVPDSLEIGTVAAISITMRNTGSTTGPGAYAGSLRRTTGPSFDAVPFDPAKVVNASAGTAALAFTDGNAGVLAYTLDGVTQTKPITRQVFRLPGTVCQ